MNKYVNVPRELFEKAFADAGFTAKKDGGELAYERFSETSQKVRVIVLTSVPWAGGQAREKDADAIRVLCLFQLPNGYWKAVSKQKLLRVNDAQGVVDRTLEAARAAYHAGIVFLRDRSYLWDEKWLRPARVQDRAAQSVPATVADQSRDQAGAPARQGRA